MHKVSVPSEVKIGEMVCNDCLESSIVTVQVGCGEERKDLESLLLIWPILASVVPECIEMLTTPICLLPIWPIVRLAGWTR
jgi:hypothetical protein